MKHMKHAHLLNLTAAIALLLVAAPIAHAQTTYDWDLGNTGGNWSPTGNWDPTGTPGAGDTANLTDTGADRVISYDASAPGSLGTLNFDQTSAFSNILDVQRHLTVSNTITLGAASGTEELRISNQGSSNVNLTGSVTVNSGGLLNLRPVGSNQAVVIGNVDLAGGDLEVNANPSTTFGRSTITGNLTMTSGSIDMAAGTDTRLQVNGNFSATGGSIATSAAFGGLTLHGTSNTINGATLDSNTGFFLTRSGDDQSFTSSATLNDIFLLVNAAARETTLTLTGGAEAGRIVLGNLSSGGSLTLKLGSDVTLKSGATLPSVSTSTSQMNSGNYGIDVDGNTFDLTGNSGVWTPNNGASGRTADWDLTSTGGAGTIRANGLNFSAANSVDVGSNVTLEVAGGNNATINMSGSGTINAASTLLYTGDAAEATPAVLTTNRQTGQLVVQQGFVRADNDPLNTVQVGNSSTTGGNINVTYSGLQINTGTFTSDIDLWSAAGTGRTSVEALVNTTLSGDLDLGSGATKMPEVIAAAGTTLEITGAVSTSGALNSIVLNASGSAGTIELGNAANDFGGTQVFISNGTVVSEADGAFGNTGNVLMADGGAPQTGANVALLAAANQTISSNITFANTRFGVTTGIADSYTLGVNNSSSATFSGDIQGLAYPNTVTNGPLNFVVTAATGGTATFSGAVSEEAAGAGESNTMNLTKTGDGSAVMSGSSSHSGTTTVSAGTLVLNGDFSAATGDVSVENGATLSGTGILGGATTVASGGTLSIGSSPGTMTFNDDLTLAAGSFSLFEIDGFGAGQYDLALGGTGTQDVAFDGTLTLDFATGFSTVGSAVLFNFENYSGSFGTVNVSGLAAGYSADFDDLTGTVSVIPEPGTFAFVLAAGGLTAFLRRRVRSRR